MRLVDAGGTTDGKPSTGVEVQFRIRDGGIVPFLDLPFPRASLLRRSKRYTWVQRMTMDLAMCCIYSGRTASGALSSNTQVQHIGRICLWLDALSLCSPSR